MQLCASGLPTKERVLNLNLSHVGGMTRVYERVVGDEPGKEDREQSLFGVGYVWQGVWLEIVSQREWGHIH